MSSPEHGTAANPMQAARRLAAPLRPKRFYEAVDMLPEAGGFALFLDGKRARTPGRNPLVVPEPRLAAAMASEWAAQGEEIDAATMPVTRLANSAIDGVATRLQETRDTILAYAGSDLLYYRAGEPDGLVARYRESWDPLLAWAERHFKARFVLAEGVMHVPQPETTLRAIGDELAGFNDPFRLAGLALATTLTGSALIALALASGAVDVDSAWNAAHVDEDWNISQWGEDQEAMARRAGRLRDFRAAALALGMPRDG